MCLLLIHFFNLKQWEYKIIQTTVPSQQNEEWSWLKLSLKIISENLKHTLWEEIRRKFLKINQCTFMEVKNSTTMRNKWQNSEKRWILKQFTLMEKNVSILILIPKHLMKRKNENFLWVFQKCTLKTNFRMCLSRRRTKEWNWRKNLETKIFSICLTILIMNKKHIRKKYWKIQEISQLILVKQNSRNTSDRSRYLAPVHLLREKSYLQFNKRDKTGKKDSVKDLLRRRS